jgi:hypothetical protein
MYNVSQGGAPMYAANGSLKCAFGKSGSSLQWVLIHNNPTGLGSPYYELKNMTGGFLHCENKKLEVGYRKEGWHSAQWDLIAVPGKPDQCHMKNRWLGSYLGMVNGVPKLVPNLDKTCFWSITFETVSAEPAPIAPVTQVEPDVPTTPTMDEVVLSKNEYLSFINKYHGMEKALAYYAERFEMEKTHTVRYYTWTTSTSVNQYWTLIEVPREPYVNALERQNGIPPTYYIVNNLFTEPVAITYNGSVTIEKFDYSTAQQWKFERQEDGYYRLVCVKAGPEKCLFMGEHKLFVATWKPETNVNGKWYFEKIASVSDVKEGDVMGTETHSIHADGVYPLIMKFSDWSDTGVYPNGLGVSTTKNAKSLDFQLTMHPDRSYTITYTYENKTYYLSENRTMTEITKHNLDYANKQSNRYELIKWGDKYRIQNLESGLYFSCKKVGRISSTGNRYFEIKIYHKTLDSSYFQAFTIK